MLEQDVQIRHHKQTSHPGTNLHITLTLKRIPDINRRAHESQIREDICPMVQSAAPSL